MSNLLNLRPLSLTLRVTFWVGLVIAMCLVTLSWTVQKSMDAHFIEQDIDELQVSVRGLKGALTEQLENREQRPVSIKSSLSNHPWVHYLILDHNKNILFERSGRHLLKQATSLEPIKKITNENLHSWQEQDIAYRGALFSHAINHQGIESNYYIFVAVTTSFHAKYLNHFEQNSWLVLLCAIAITFVATWAAVHQGHHPLRAISQDIHNINSSQSNKRLDAALFPVELKNIVTELNQMLCRIESNYNRISHFSDDIAHELRTPITNLMTLTQVTLSKERDTEQYQEVLYENLEQYERLAKMVNDMLLLAKSENGRAKTAFTTLDLKDEVNAVVEYFEPLIHEKLLTLTFDCCSASILADSAMIRRALSNIYSNAIRLTVSNNQITTKLMIVKNTVHLSIENQGPTISPHHLERLFDRFYRVDGARNSSGVGLGLAITRSIIEHHGGSIIVASANNLTKFTIILPIMDS